MARIRALVVDDDPRLVDSMKNRLGREIDWDVEWETAIDVDEAQRLMASSATPYDLVVADLMFRREDVPDLDDPSGLDLIKDASRRSGRTFILAITTGRDYLPDLMENARRLGAHHVVRRNDFSTASTVHSPAAIAAIAACFSPLAAAGCQPENWTRRTSRARLVGEILAAMRERDDTHAARSVRPPRPGTRRW